MAGPQSIFGKKQSPDALSSIPLIVSLILFIALAFFIRWNLNPSDNITLSDQTAEFSAESAKQMLTTVLGDEIPHPVDSIEARNTEKRIINILRGFGYQEEIQQTMSCEDYKNRSVRCAKVRNIIVSIASDKSQKSDKRSGILLSSHYDSVDAGPGASDAGVAVATMLEIARLMSTQPKPKNPIVLLFNEGEEYGLFGARSFMQEHPLAKTLKLAINIEARGSKGSSVMFETGENSGWLINEYLRYSPKVLSSSLFYEAYKALPNNTDLTIFKDYGLQGLNFAHAEKLTHYHTPLDNLANLELATIQHHGDNVWRVLQNIKDKDLNQQSLLESNLVYTDVLSLFTLKWQEPTSLVIAVLLVVFFLFAVIRVFKTECLSKESILRGVYSFFILLIAIPLFSYLLQLSLSSLSATNAPWLVNSLPMQIALWSLLTLFTLLFGRYFLKNSQALSVMVGQIGCWILLGITTSYFMVGISFLFLIPAAVSTLILLLYSYRIGGNRGRDEKGSLHLSYVVNAIVIAILFMPVFYTLEIMVTYHMTLILGVMFAFIMTSLLPMLPLAKDKHLRQLHKLLLSFFVIACCWTVFQPSFDVSSKQRMNVYYLQDNANDAHLITGSENNKPSEKLDNVLPELTLSEVFLWSGSQHYNQSINNEGLAASEIEIVNDHDLTKNKMMRLRINSTEMSDSLREVKIYIPKKSNIKSVNFMNQNYKLDERSVNAKGYVEFRCIGLSCNYLEIDLEKTSSVQKPVTEILVVKVLQGLPNNLLKVAENRGGNAHQSQFGDRSYIVKRIEL